MGDIVDQDAAKESSASAPLSWTKAHSARLFLVSLPAIGLWVTYSGSARMMWLAYFALALAIAILISHGTTRRPRGILIDERNVMSLSRFPMVHVARRTPSG